MAEPSAYELDAWRRLQNARSRPLTRVMHVAGDRTASAARAVAQTAERLADDHPAVRRAQGAVARGARGAAGAVPPAVTRAASEWGQQAFDSIQRAVARVSRVGLSPDGVVAKYRKRGMSVDSLADIRRLDLEDVDRVRGRGMDVYYPAAAAASGAGAGLVITGGELFIAVSGGAGAAPGSGAVAGAMVADAAAVLGIASRAVGHVALTYGYDPEDPAEKLFVLTVINAGTAMSASAKTAAMAELSTLTQALFRGAAWKVLDKSIVAQVYKQFASRFAVRVTKQSLGKVVPGLSIVLGAGFNWATLEMLIDGANQAYRRRLLLEKYPQLESDEVELPLEAVVPDDQDVTISVLRELTEAGGPDVRPLAPEGNDEAGSVEGP